MTDNIKIIREIEHSKKLKENQEKKNVFKEALAEVSDVCVEEVENAIVKVKKKQRIKYAFLLISLSLIGFIFILSFQKNLRESKIGDIFLGDLVPLESDVNWWGIQVGHHPDGYKVMVNGEECEKFILTHAPASVSYAIPNGVKSFSFYGVVPEYQGLFGAWCHEVKIDGVAVFKSNAMNMYVEREFFAEIEIPEGAKELQLIANEMGDANSDHAVWAYPYFD